MPSTCMSGQKDNYEILAKSNGETLSEHTIACLKASQALMDSLPINDEKKDALKKDALLSIAMHDIGKAAIGFQKVLKNEQDNWQGKRHEIISASFASGIDGISPIVIFAILTHHKCIPSDGISQSIGCLLSEQIPSKWMETPIWKEMAYEWKQNHTKFIKEWEKICNYIGFTFNTSDLKPLSLQFLPWIERTGKRGQRKSISFQDRYYASLVRGLTIASDHLGSAHKIPPPIPKLCNFSVLKCNPRPFQEHVGNIEESLILRAPTGSGKTEAALLWAQKNQKHNGRLFYVLPYTASINAMHRRLMKIFSDDNVGLLHHRATSSLYTMLEDDSEITSRLDNQNIAKILAGLAHEIWFPIRVCTPHQILRYTLRGKGWEYMLAEFPNACFIFDEIHAYDPRVVGLTLRSAKLVNDWGARCLFISATLPSFLRKLIINNVGDMSFIEPNSAEKEDKEILDKKRHNISVIDGSIQDNLEIIIQAINKSPSTLIVCNHVKTSQYIYSILKEKFSSENIKLLHSRFNQEDRNRIEDEIINNALPKILVATQVVEVSLDIDFDQAFLEPAPIDALIQRMGRVNRSGNRPPADIIIFTKQISKYNIYCNCTNGSHTQNCRIKMTIDELQKLENPISEQDLVKGADIVYGDGYQGKDKIKFEEGYNHPDLAEFEQRILAGAYQDWVEEIIEKTDGVMEILPECLLMEYNRRKDIGLWIEANNLLVPIRKESFTWLKSKIDSSKDPWIAKLDYSSNIGLEL